MSSSACRRRPCRPSARRPSPQFIADAVGFLEVFLRAGSGAHRDQTLDLLRSKPLACCLTAFSAPATLLGQEAEQRSELRTRRVSTRRRSRRLRRPCSSANAAAYSDRRTALRAPSRRPASPAGVDGDSRYQSSQRLRASSSAFDGPVDRRAIMRLAASRNATPHPASFGRRSVCSAARIVTKLPRLFDIFSPSTCRKPLCIQMFAITGVPCAQRDCAISFS